MAEVFKALSNPHRLRILLKLARDCTDETCCSAGSDAMRHCVGDLGRDLGLAASTVSHHLKELRRAGLMNIERCGQRIECWVDRETLDALSEFLAGTQEPTGDVEK